MYFLRKFDLSGICIMILGCTTAPFYYAFMCDELAFYRYLYLGFSYTCCLSAVYIALSPAQKDFKNAWILAASFIFAGLSCLPGMVHLFWFMDDKYMPKSEMPVGLFVWGGVSYITGAILYAKKWPESRFPGRFDYLGNSHNIFHVACLIGAFVHWWGTIRVFHLRQLYQCPI